MIAQRHMICPACWILSILIFFMSGFITSSMAFSPDYLSSLSKKTNTNNDSIQQPTTSDSNADIQHGQNNNNMNTNEQDDIPNEHYSKHYPNAGWRGYENSQWGGYLDNLNSDTNQLEEGKKSDYGDDVRWGTEVYLNSIEKGNEKV